MIFKLLKNEGKHLNLILDCKAVERVHSARILGVEIDDKLTWRNHVQQIEKRLSSAIYII